MTARLSLFGRFTAVLAISLGLSACAGTDVEFKGGVFDAIGVNSVAAKRDEPKMTNRPGIVMPPSTASLPAPGSVPKTAVAANGQAFPVDPETQNKAKTDAMIAEHNRFCQNARQRFEAGVAPSLEPSPYGPCEESALRSAMGIDAVSKIRKGEVRAR